MIAALLSCSDLLPAPVIAGLNVATSTGDLRQNEGARVKLWEFIHGREQEGSSEVLAARLAIITLHPSEITRDLQTSLEYFVHWFRQANLPEIALTNVAAMEAYYHEA